MNTSNLKDTVTTIAGLIVAVGGSLLALDGVSPTVKTYIGIAIAVSVGLIGWLTGKAPSGAAKTNNQLSEQNKKNP